MSTSEKNQKTEIEKPPSCVAARAAVQTIPEKGLSRKVRPIQYYVEENNCWIIISHKASNSRGILQLYRNNKTLILARYVYELLRGTIPERHILVNTCGNIHCCNPDHFTVEDKGYFNTREYMKTHNPGHYEKILKRDRTTRKGGGRVNYERIFARIREEFGDTLSESNSELSKLASQGGDESKESN